MLTATKDLMLPATVTGSWPRPRWYDGGLWGRPLDTRAARRPLPRAVPRRALDGHRRPGAGRARHPHQRRLSPRRGLRRPLVAPLPAAALEGLRARGAPVRGLARPAARVPARHADERDRDDVALAARRRQGRARPAQPARVREALADRPGARASGKPVKFGTCSSQVLSIFLDSHTTDYDLEDKKQLIWDMATAMNLELRQLAAAGAKVIQIEEPTIHFVALLLPRPDRAARLPRRRVQPRGRRPRRRRAVDPHLLGQPEHAEGLHGRVVRELDRDLPRAAQGRRLDGRGDRERARRDRPVQAVCREPVKKKVAVGVVNHRTLQADMAPVVAGRVRRAMEVIPADKLILSSDCGFGRQGFSRTDRVLQGDRDRPGAEHRPEGARARGALRGRRPTRPCRPTCSPTTSR